jgi:hypothetical protein
MRNNDMAGQSFGYARGAAASARRRAYTVTNRRGFIGNREGIRMSLSHHLPRLPEEEGSPDE